jgi:hypothetical protein
VAVGSPAVFAESYPQLYPQVRPDRAKPLTGQQQTPPYAKSTDYLTYTPQQKIFAKVKAAI